MQISVSGRHLHVSQAEQDYVRSKLAKLGQFFDKIQKVDVIVSKEGPEYSMEIIVKPDHHGILVGRNSGPDIQTCVDIVLDKLERQLTKHKEKVRNHKRRQAGPAETISEQ